MSIPRTLLPRDKTNLILLSLFNYKHIRSLTNSPEKEGRLQAQAPRYTETPARLLSQSILLEKQAGLPFLYYRTGRDVDTERDATERRSISCMGRVNQKIPTDTAACDSRLRAEKQVSRRRECSSKQSPRRNLSKPMDNRETQLSVGQSSSVYGTKSWLLTVNFSQSPGIYTRTTTERPDPLSFQPEHSKHLAAQAASSLVSGTREWSCHTSRALLVRAPITG